jgi:CRISPR-associated exonuclease Cas4
MEGIDYLPLSMLNQLEYCERRFFLMHVQGEMEVNAPVLDGTQLHARSHTPGASSEGGVTVHRRVYVWSERLRLSGFADVVEESAGPDGAPQMCPIEYKRGKMGRWLNDHVQLCAQAVCLEESAARVGQALRIEQGYLFYFGSRRREQVAITAELRAHTEVAVRRAYELIAAGRLPPPTEKRAKCRDCSLQPVCLPAESDVWSGRVAPRGGVHPQISQMDADGERSSEQ